MLISSHGAVAIRLMTLYCFCICVRADEPRLILREDMEQNPQLRADYSACLQSGKKAEECPVSRLYFQTSKASVALGAVGNLYALIAMPHPTAGRSETARADVRLVSPVSTVPSRFARQYLEVDLSLEVSDKLVRYLGTLQAGLRYEPVIEVKNLVVGSEVQTLIAVVPVGLTIEFSDDESVFLNGEAAFRAIYVPHWMDPAIADARYWTATQSGAPSLIVCGVEFSNNESSKKANLLKLGLQGLAEVGDGTVTFLPPSSPTTRNSPASPSSGSELSRQQFSLPKPFTRPQRPARPLSFRFGSPVVVTDYPVYLRAELTSSASSQGGRSNIVGADLNVNFDSESKSPGPLKAITILGRPDLSIAPAIKLKVNNILNVDNENSFRWWAPIAWTKPFGSKCVGSACTSGLCCTKPFLRSFSLTAGLSGEHSGYNQNQNIVVPIGAIWRFRTFNASARKDWNISLDIFAGSNLGRVINKTTKAYITTADETRTIEFKPRQDTGIVRLHGQTKLSIGLGKSRSFNFAWDRWQLLRSEQFLAPMEIAGTFNSARPALLPPNINWEPINQKVTLFIPEYRKGFRHYWTGKFVWELTSNVSFDASYFRGELPPAFQYVDKFTIGIAFQIKP